VPPDIAKNCANDFKIGEKSLDYNLLRKLSEPDDEELLCLILNIHISPVKLTIPGGSIILLGLALSQIELRQSAQQTMLNSLKIEQMKLEMGMRFKGI
jgi:hypothetical protein